MSRNTEYKFVETDGTKIEAELIAAYEKITKHTLGPSDPDRLFIAWIADVIIKARVDQNYTGNQNIPSRAEGTYLDALGMWIFNLPRKSKQAAKCTQRFNISAAQETSIAIPAGTRVSDKSKKLVWSTTEDVLIPMGETYADVMLQCESAGIIGNGYAEGQINTLIDVDNVLYFSSCSNITVSDGGAEQQSDEEYFESIREVADSYSTAGAEGSYIYWAKSVSSEINDIKVVCPTLDRNEVLPLYSDADGKKIAFLGGDQIKIDTLMVYSDDFSVLLESETDYTADYTNGLVKIILTGSEATISLSSIGVNVKQLRAGYVYIYALMNDGSIAGDTVKTAIYNACNSKDVRPLTDCVVVDDPETVDYNINFTYYVSKDTQLSISDIEAAVANAVNEYVAWQCAKLGRDINPDKLSSLLMQAGIKRKDIKSPVYIKLRSDNDDIPQVAKVNTINITNGGYEDE